MSEVSSDSHLDETEHNWPDAREVERPTVRPTVENTTGKNGKSTAKNSKEKAVATKTTKQKSVKVATQARSNGRETGGTGFDLSRIDNVHNDYTCNNEGAISEIASANKEQPTEPLASNAVGQLVEVMKAGFSEITDVIRQERPSKRGKKRARHESLSDSSSGESEDVEMAIDNLLKETSAEGGKDENKDENKEDNDENVDIFEEFEEEYDLEEKCGPSVQKQLAAIVNKMARTKLSDELLKEKLNKVHRPKNCEKLVATKVNPEIWGKVTSTTRSRDVKFQKVQSVLLKAISGLTHVADKLYEKDKDATKSILNSIALITHANCDLNHRRRDMIKPDLNKSYQQICSEQLQATDMLFGDDLAQKIKDINTTNRVAGRLLDNSKHYKSSYGHDSYRKSSYPKNGQRAAWKGGHHKKQWYNNKNHSYPQKKREEGRGDK